MNSEISTDNLKIITAEDIDNLNI